MRDCAIDLFEEELNKEKEELKKKKKIVSKCLFIEIQSTSGIIMQFTNTEITFSGKYKIILFSRFRYN